MTKLKKLVKMCNEPKNCKKGLAKLVTMSYNDNCRVAEATNNT